MFVKASDLALIVGGKVSYWHKVKCAARSVCSESTDSLTAQIQKGSEYSDPIWDLKETGRVQISTAVRTATPAVRTARVAVQTARVTVQTAGGPQLDRKICDLDRINH